MKDLIEQKKILLSLYEKIKVVDKDEKLKYRELIEKAKAPLNEWFEGVIRKIQIEEINPLIKSGEKKSYFDFHFDNDMISIDKNHKDYKVETDRIYNGGLVEGVYYLFPKHFIFSLLKGIIDVQHEHWKYDNGKISFNSDLQKMSYFVLGRYYQLSNDLFEEGETKPITIFSNNNYFVNIKFKELSDISEIFISFYLMDKKSGLSYSYNVKEEYYSFIGHLESVSLYHFTSSKELKEIQRLEDSSREEDAYRESLRDDIPLYDPNEAWREAFGDEAGQAYDNCN